MRLEHLALWWTGDGGRGTGDGLPSSARSTNWFRKRERDLLPPKPPSSLLAVPRLAPPPPSFSFSDEDAMERSRSGLSFEPRPRSSYSSGSLSQRKIYVNRHVDTCLNVASARAEGEGLGKSGSWYAVSDFAVSRVGVKGGEVGVREKRTPRDAVARRRVYTHTHTRARARATRTLGLPAVSWIKTIRDGWEWTGIEGGRTYVFAYNKREVMLR